jgi:Spy/CpxP family protein refolding chaperone
MRRSFVLASVLVLSAPFVSASIAAAQNAPRTSALRAAGGFAASGIEGTNQTQAERDIAQYEKVVKLTAEQKQKIKEIYDARDKELKEYQASITEKMQAQQAAMNEAARSGDQTKIAAASQGFRALFAPQQEIVKRGQESLRNVLTPEQKQKVQEQRFADTIAAYAPGVKLTEAQMNLLRIGSTTGAGELEGYEGVLHELLGKTLTAEQTKEVLAHRLNQMLEAQFRNAGLTPEQQAKIDARIKLMLENHPKTMHIDGVVYQKIRDYFNDQLTAEQKEKLRFPRAS